MGDVLLPLESDFLVPNATFLVLVLLVLMVLVVPVAVVVTLRLSRAPRGQRGDSVVGPPSG